MDRIPDVDLHMAAVKAREPSLTQLQLEVIHEIVYLRRQVDPEEHLARFRAILQDGGSNLLASFSTRWLVSIADTFADYGSGWERANAMIIVVLANVTKLAETERLTLKNANVDIGRQTAFATPGTPLWDGMTSYALKEGDMPKNMWTRVRALMMETPTLSFIFEAVLARMAVHDTLIGRLAALNPSFL